MEKGFYHPDKGYWQTNDNVSDEILNSYPEGTVEVPIKPGMNFEWNGSSWIKVTPEPDLNIILTPYQWQYFLDLTGFREQINYVLEQMPKTTLEERAKWAALKTVAFQASQFELNVVMVLIDQMSAQLPGIPMPTEEEIRQAFLIASNFNGVYSII